jgi:prolyl 4-hydroxylase
VKPERGKAILFYNLLPDGNYDDRSQHAAEPVTQGEKVRKQVNVRGQPTTPSSTANHPFYCKWLINLWVWDPILDHTIAQHY